MMSFFLEKPTTSITYFCPVQNDSFFQERPVFLSGRVVPLFIYLEGIPMQFILLSSENSRHSIPLVNGQFDLLASFKGTQSLKKLHQLLRYYKTTGKPLEFLTNQFWIDLSILMLNKRFDKHTIISLFDKFSIIKTPSPAR